MKYIFVTGGVVSSLGKGLAAASLGTLENRGLKVVLQKFDPYLNVDPGHDEPVPARRGLCARRRRGDRPRPRPLRALHQRRADPREQPHQRPGLPDGAREGAPRRISRQDRAGDPARHRRNQAPHPRAAASNPEADVLHHRNRRHHRRHRGPAVSRGHPPVRARGRARTTSLSSTSPRAVHQGRRRAEDQAHPAIRRQAARNRHPAAGPHLPHRASARRRKCARRFRMFCNVPVEAVIEGSDVDHTIYEVPLDAPARGARRHRLPLPRPRNAPPPDMADWKRFVQRVVNPKKQRPHRRRRQIHRAAGRLQIDLRIAHPAGGSARLRRRNRAGGCRGNRERGRGRVFCEAWPASWCPAASANAASRARSWRRNTPAKTSMPYLGLCLGMQIATHRIRPQRLRPRGREHHRVRSRDARIRSSACSKSRRT